MSDLIEIQDLAGGDKPRRYRRNPGVIKTVGYWNIRGNLCYADMLNVGVQLTSFYGHY
jgi:hypothetical protein